MLGGNLITPSVAAKKNPYIKNDKICAEHIRLVTITMYVAMKPKAIPRMPATTFEEDTNKSTLIDPMPFRVSPRKTTKNIFKHVSTNKPKLDNMMKLRIDIPLDVLDVFDVPRPVVQSI